MEDDFLRMVKSLVKGGKNTHQYTCLNKYKPVIFIVVITKYCVKYLLTIKFHSYLFYQHFRISCHREYREIVSEVGLNVEVATQGTH